MVSSSFDVDEVYHSDKELFEGILDQEANAPYVSFEGGSTDIFEEQLSMDSVYTANDEI